MTCLHLWITNYLKTENKGREWKDHSHDRGNSVAESLRSVLRIMLSNLLLSDLSFEVNIRWTCLWMSPNYYRTSKDVPPLDEWTTRPYPHKHWWCEKMKYFEDTGDSRALTFLKSQMNASQQTSHWYFLHQYLNTVINLSYYAQSAIINLEHTQPLLSLKVEERGTESVDIFLQKVCCLA